MGRAGGSSGTLRAVIGTLIGVLVGLGPAWWAISAARLGHGSYLPASISFPYAMMVAAVPLSVISGTYIALALIQYPFYGALIAISPRPKLAAAILGSAHLGAAVFACLLTKTSEHFR